MNVLEAIRTKRAVREFTDQPVPEEIIRQIVNAGRLAPSSMNSQPWTFIVIRDRDTLCQLADCHRWAAHLAQAAFGVALVTSDPWAFDSGQAAAYLQLAAWELGVSSCLTYMTDQERAKSILGIPNEMIFEIAISFGYAKNTPEPRPNPAGRKNFDQVVRWDKW